MGALNVARQRPVGAELGALLDRLRDAEREQADAEERLAPLAEAWLEAHREDLRLNEAWWAAHATVLDAEGARTVRRREAERARLGLAREDAGARLNVATMRLATAAQGLEALRVEVASIRAVLGAGEV